MASHPSGFLNQAVKLLLIKTNLFDLHIIGKPFHPTVEALKLHRDAADDWVDATLHVTSRHHGLHVESIEVLSPVTGEMVDAGCERVLPCFYETQTYELVIENKSPHTLAFFHENVYLRQAIKSHSHNTLSGMLNFQNEIGYTDLSVLLDGIECLNIQLEIFPTKLDYQTDYQAILQDVNQQIYNLSFDFMRKTYHLTGLKETSSQSLTEFFTILQHLFQQLVHAIERIQDAPHYRLFQDQRVNDAAKIKHSGRENIAFLSKNPQYLLQDEARGFLNIKGALYRPTRLIETKRKLDWDTGENRFLRWMLLRIESKLKQMYTYLNGKDYKSDPLLLERIYSMQTQLRRLLQIDFLRDVGTMRQMSISLVLQMAPGYRDAYRMYLMLTKGLSIQSDLFHISMKDMAKLYEYWCFLKIHSLLSKKYKLVKQDIIRINRSGLFVTLDKTQQAKVEYENPANGERFELYYNNLPLEDKKARTTLSQQPDNVLTLRKHDVNQQDKVYKYVFDAKYRLDAAYEGTVYHRNYGGLPGPQEEDINTMHRYRDAIVYQDKSSQEYERSMFGAYVLFPYGDEELFKQHRFYKSIALVNIGAFPFLPKATSLMEQFLDELIMDSPEKAYERSTRPRGTGDYYQNKLGGRNVLVGSLKDKQQLDVVNEHLYYHTPLSNISDHKLLTQLEYVAIYQSKNWFGAEGHGVHLYGRIIDWQVLKRGDIKERTARSGSEHQLYVKFVVEKWLVRAVPIMPGGLGVRSCLLTTKYMFDRAMEIAELKLTTDEQLQEWREKRRQGRVLVKLDHEQVDMAKEVLGIQVME